MANNKTTSLQGVKKDTAYLLQNERRQRGMLAPPTVEDNYIQRMRDKAVQNLALMGIVIASAAMSTMALDPTKLFNYMAGALTFQSAFYSTLVLVVFMCLVLGFLLLHLSGMENKTEVMMLIQSLLGLAIIVSITITLCAFVLEGITELVN